MRNISKLILSVLLLSTAGAFAADGSDFVMRKAADGTDEFMPGVTPAQVDSPLLAAAVPIPESSSISSTVRVAGLLLIAAGVGLLLLWRHKRSSIAAAPDARRMKLLERLPIGPRRELLMIQACDRVLVIACQANQMSLISDLAIDVGPAPASFNQVAVERGLEKEIQPEPEPQTEQPPPLRPIYIPPTVKITDTIAISAEARKKDWPDLKEAS